MTPLQAEEIINSYWKSMKDLRPDAIVQPISDLPCSPGKIKYSHFVYGEELIKKNLLTKKIGDQLTKSYAQIDSNFVEEPEPIKIKYRETLKELDKGVITKDFRVSNITNLTVEREIEYNNFLADYQGNYIGHKQVKDKKEGKL